VSSREVAERLRNRRVKAEIQTAEGTLFVRGLTGKERSEYFSWLSGDGTGNILFSDLRLLTIALCDENGASIFENEQQGLEVLQDWNHADVQAAAKKALSLSGMGKDAAEEAEKKS
jgi:hypothetical protein